LGKAGIYACFGKINSKPVFSPEVNLGGHKKPKLPGENALGVKGLLRK
jgi:hypothetical protein